MKKITFLLAISGFLLWGTCSKAQTLRWTTFETLHDSLRKERRPLLVFIHTDWCQYCKMMEAKTFTDPQIVSALNEQFYCLNLNAEQKQPLLFLNKKYKFKPSGMNTGIHELAELLGSEKGKLTYPTTVFFDQNLQLQSRFVGVLDAKRLQSIFEK